ncbi:glycosyltransferase family 4 protein [Ancylomarina sp. DW003]|nr:glycosyltransferase family 4 protein [Ancylomarina sp. DW003]MDE5421921.1 glycosyltransferase family 4 protein [Ancylomarina sp. DW003]
MKILFLTDNFPPEVNAPATRTYEHCREWVKAGADVTVITCFPNFPQGKVYNGYRNKPFHKEEIDGIKVIRVWSYITANEGFIKRTFDFISFSLTSFIAGLFQKTDLIVATSPQFFTALSGRTLSFWKRKPWVMEVRDLWPESIKTVGALNDNIFIKYFDKEALFCYKRADKIIVVTDSFKKDLVSKGIKSDKIEVVKNGANLDLFQPIDKDISLLKELNLEGKKVLGYIGTHGMAHKLDFILDCAKELDANVYHILLIGAGAEKEKLKKKVQDENISNVTMLDSVSKDEVKRYLSILDASIINLKKSELFKTVIPSKIFENAAMQIPILMGVDGEARGIVEKYEAGLFYEPENKKDFLDKVDVLLNDDEKIQECKLGGEKLAQAFDRKVLAERMLNVLENLN